MTRCWRTSIVDIRVNACERKGRGNAVKRQPAVIDDCPSRRMACAPELVFPAAWGSCQQDILVDRYPEIVVGRISALEDRERVDVGISFAFPEWFADGEGKSQRRRQYQTRQQQHHLGSLAHVFPPSEVLRHDDASLLVLITAFRDRVHR